MRREKEKDYLAPFLARLGDKEHLTVEEKGRVREDCLRDAESRQEVVANIIQAHFERVGVVTWWAGLNYNCAWVVPRPLMSRRYLLSCVGE